MVYHEDPRRARRSTRKNTKIHEKHEGPRRARRTGIRLPGFLLLVLDRRMLRGSSDPSWIFVLRLPLDPPPWLADRRLGQWFGGKELERGATELRDRPLHRG